MYERSYGYRYDEIKDLSTVEIAKRIRADIKQAVAEGMLPEKWSYSVTSDRASMMTSIDVRVRDCADAWQECDGTVPGTWHDHGDGVRTATACSNVWCAARNDPAYAHGATKHDVLTEEAQVAKMTLERIHGGYNHNGSDMMVDYFDVRYYGHVEFEDARSADFRAREKERLAARKAARDSGTVVGKVANYGRQRTVVHLLVENTEGKQVLGCGARAWRGSRLVRVNDDAAVTCSRCARREG